MQEELEDNRMRLSMTRKLMKKMKEEVDQCESILRREVGSDVHIPSLIRCSGGQVRRSQQLMNLRLKVAALRSQLSEPVHMSYYRGPFDPRRRFDLDMLPQKEDNVYKQALVDQRRALIRQGKAIETLQTQLKDLSLMHRATCYRSKSLTRRIRSVSSKIKKLKSRSLDNAHIIECMICHQNLVKLMLDPDTFELDPDVKRTYEVYDIRDRTPQKVPEVHKYKSLYEDSEEEVREIQQKLSSMAEKLDNNVSELVKVESICTGNRRGMESLKPVPVEEDKGSVKDKKNKKKAEKSPVNDQNSELAKEIAVLVEENNYLRDFLLSPVFSKSEDLMLFFTSVTNAAKDFSLSLDDIKSEI